eukprot:TRINITY_DN842_c0_g1_i2.p1 TRINITY_DN842_c0_g1~~TRINITY_DN842_c0_g1_i2.p1  ORF type:complete len:476 (+),score=137.83 TRINITY_DN842_c0_g1_i2:54-1481(+)
MTRTTYEQIDAPYPNPCGGCADAGKFRDVWFALVWLGALGGSIYMGVRNYLDGGYYGGNDAAAMTTTLTTTTNTLTGVPPVPIAMGAVTAAAFAVLLMYLARSFPVPVIWVCNIVIIIVEVALAGMLLLAHPAQTIGGAILLIFAAIHCCWLYCSRHRIPFAGQCLATACRVNVKYWGTFVVSVVTTAFLVATAVAVFVALSTNTEAFPLRPLSYVFVFILFWHEEVLQNVIHVTTVGVTADWFFSLGGPGTPALYQQKSAYPTAGAFKRATTWSLGSICFGSLFVAILKTIRCILESMRDQNSVLDCFIICILGCIENLVRYFNDYAFVQVGVYGKPYITAAKDTWALVTSGTLWGSIVNDMLVNAVFSIFVLVGTLLTVGVLYLTKIPREHCGLADCDEVVGLVLSGVAALLILVLFMKQIYSSMMTVFICYADLAAQGHQWRSVDIGGETATMAQCLDEKRMAYAAQETVLL